MALHPLASDGRPRRPVRIVRKNGLLQLGWSHFWLLIGILGGTLALVVLALLAHLTFTA
jgi:hypothetical protein